MPIGLKAQSISVGSIYNVALSNLVEQDGFNVRTDYGDLDAMAKAFANGTPIPPLKVHYDKDIDKIVIVDGHRRFRAAKIAVDKYKAEIQALACYNEERGSNEISRIFDLFTCNSGKPLTALEEGAVINRLTNFKWKISDIAKRIGKSQTYVSGLLDIQESSKELKDAIQKQIISTSAALKMAKVSPKEQLRILDKLSKNINPTSSKKTIKVKDVEKETKGTPAMISTKGILLAEKEVENMVNQDRTDHKTWVAVLYGIHIALKKAEFSDKFRT